LILACSAPGPAGSNAPSDDGGIFANATEQ
jgi:hypothetical protein